MVTETKAPTKDKEVSPMESVDVFNFLQGQQDANDGMLPQFLDRSFAQVETPEESEEREEYYRVSGDQDRTDDYRKSLEPAARAIASDGKEGIFTQAINIYGRRFRNAWADLNGKQREEVNTYDNQGSFISEFIADAGVPVSVGIAGGVAALAGVGAIPILLGGGAALAANAMVQAGGEKDEVERLDTFLEPAVNFTSDVVAGRRRSAKKKLGDKTWEGFIGDEGQASYGKRVAAIMAADVLDGLAVGKTVKVLGKAFKHLIPKTWFKRNAKMLDLQANEAQQEAYTALNKKERQLLAKKIIRDNKNLKLLQERASLEETNIFLDEQITAKQKIAELAETRRVSEEMFPPEVGDSKTVARQAGGRHHLARAGNALGKVKKSTSIEEIGNELDTFTDSRLLYEQTPRGKAGKTRVTDPEGKTGVEKMEDIQQTPTEVVMRDQHHGDVITSDVMLDDLWTKRADLAEQGKMTPELDVKFQTAIDVEKNSQKLVKRKAAIDMAYSKGAVKTNKEIERLQMDRLRRAYKILNATGKERDRLIELNRQVGFKIRGIRTQQLDAEGNGDVMYALGLGLRGSVDTFLAKGALVNSLWGNIAGYTVANVASLFKRQGAYTALADLAQTVPDMGRYIYKRVAKSDSWKNMVKEMSTSKDVYRTRTELDDTGAIKKTLNAATAVNQQLLQEMDHFFRHSFEQIADREAFRMIVERRMRAGFPVQQIQKEMEMAVQGKQALPLDYVADWNKTRATWHKRIQMRANRGDDVPLLAKPWWTIHEAADILRDVKNPVLKFGGQALGVFSRVGANMGDWVGRNTALGLIDTPKNISLRLSQNKAEMAVGTLGTLLMYSKSNIGNSLIGHHSILSDSRKKGRSFNMNPGVIIDGEFVDLKKFGGVGMAVETLSVMEDTMNLMVAEGQDDSAETLAKMGHRLVNYMTKDSWLTGSVLSLLSAFDREEPGQRDKLKEILITAIPGKGFVERFEAMSKGYRPDAYFLNTVGEMSDWLPEGPSRDAFGDIYTNSLQDRTNADETGFPLALGRMKLFLNPSEQDIPTSKIELNNFLLGAGAFSASKTISYTTKSGKVINFDKNTMNGKFAQTMTVLNRNVNVPGSGTYRMTERDYHAAKALLSLKPEAAKRTMESWMAAYETIKADYPNHDVLSEFAQTFIADYLQADPKLTETRAVFDGYVPAAMINNPDKGLSDFLHYIATTPMDKMESGASETVTMYAEAFKLSLQNRHVMDKMRLEEGEIDELALILGRRNLVVEMFNTIKKRVAQFSTMAPSVVEQASETRMIFSRDEEINDTVRRTP